MATNQELRQAAARTLGGTALDYNGDMSAMFTAAGIATNLDFNSRFLLWLNAQLTASYTNLPQAMAAYAASKSVARWDDVTAFSAPPSLNLDFTSSMPAGVTVVSSPAGYAPTSTGLLTSFAANAGRRTNAGILVEAAATNFLTNSIAPAATNGWGGGAATITAGQFNDPAGGSLTMAALAEDTSNGGHYAFGNLAAVQAAGTYTMSAWVSPKGAARSPSLRLEGQSVFYNISTVAPFANTIQAATIQHISTFYYLTATFVTAANSGTAFIQIGDSSGNGGYLGDGASGYYYWGAQLEAGAKATSIVTTTTTSASRTADQIQFTVPAGISNLTYTFDDNSTQLVSGVSSGTYTIPTTLNRAQIKTIVGS